jgi:hypothetical protein
VQAVREKSIRGMNEMLGCEVEELKMQGGRPYLVVFSFFSSRRVVFESMYEANLKRLVLGCMVIVVKVFS